MVPLTASHEAEALFGAEQNYNLKKVVVWTSWHNWYLKVSSDKEGLFVCWLDLNFIAIYFKVDK